MRYLLSKSARIFLAGFSMFSLYYSNSFAETQEDIWIFIDGSGSYNSSHFKSSRNNIIEIAKSANPGSSIQVRWISGNSFSDNNIIVKGKLPVVPEVDNVFSPKEKRARKVAMILYLKSRQRVIDKISIMKSPKANYTDINGAIARYSQYLKTGENRGKKRILIFMSDMDGNVGKTPDAVNLQGVTVKIINFQENKISDRMNGWTKNFKSWNVDRIVFRY